MPSSKDLSNPWIEPEFPASSALQASSLPLSHQGSPKQGPFPAKEYQIGLVTLDTYAHGKIFNTGARYQLVTLLSLSLTYLC